MWIYLLNKPIKFPFQLNAETTFTIDYQIIYSMLEKETLKESFPFFGYVWKDKKK
jgi:hypothetical protein